MQLREKLAELSSYQEIKNKFLSTGKLEFLRGFLQERKAFEQFYQAEVMNLLGRWLYNGQFLENIQFGSDGCVNVDGSLIISGIDYFPSLIKRVNGSLNLSGGRLASIDNLEYIGGSCKLRKLKRLRSLKSLKHVEGGLYCLGSKIKDLSSLQTVGASLQIGRTPNLQSLPNLQRVGYSLRLGDQGFKKFPSLKSIGLLQFSGKNRSHFREVFPSLETIGANLQHISVITVDTGMKDEILEEERQGRLQVQGRVVIN